MKVKILGTSCARCNTLEQKVRKLIESHQLKADVQKISDISEMISYGIVRTPGLVINERLVSNGIIPKDEQLLHWLKEDRIK